MAPLIRAPPATDTLAETRESMQAAQEALENTRDMVSIKRTPPENPPQVAEAAARPPPAMAQMDQTRQLSREMTSAERMEGEEPMAQAARPVQLMGALVLVETAEAAEAALEAGTIGSGIITVLLP